MRNGWPVVALLLTLAGPSVGSAQDLVQWVDPGERRVTVVGAAGDQPQVRFRNGWETADYVPFTWGEMTGELVYGAAHDGAALDFPLTSTEIPRLFRIGKAGGVMPGKSGRGAGLLGSAFGQRFTVSGMERQCFSFQSADASSPTNSPGLARRVIYGYACAPVEEPRPRIEEFLRALRFVDAGFVEDGGPMPMAAETSDAREFALGRDDPGSLPRGLAEVPLGYAVPDPDGGS